MGHRGRHDHHHHHGHDAPPPNFYPPMTPPMQVQPYGAGYGVDPYAYQTTQPYPGGSSNPYGQLPVQLAPYGQYPMQPTPYAPAPGYGGAAPYNPDLNQAMADHHRHARNEHVAEVGAVAAGAFAMYEAHEMKVDPEHARRHKLEAEAAGAMALGSTVYAFHEHHEKKKDEHLIASMGGYGDTSHGHHHKHEEHHHHNKHHNQW